MSVGLSCLASCAREPAAPVADEGTKVGALIVEGASSWDAGLVEEGTELTKSFTLRNEGSAAIRLARVSKSCTCTDAALSRTELGPGETASLDLKTTTKGATGSLSATVTVVYERGEEKGYRVLSISALVGKSVVFVLDPARIDLGIAAPDSQPSGTLDVLLKARWGVELPNVPPPPPFSAQGVAQELVLEPGVHQEGEFIVRRGTLRIRFPRGLESGRVSRRIELDASCGARVITAVATASVQVRDFAEFSDPGVFFDGLRVGEHSAKSVSFAWIDAAARGKLAVERAPDWAVARLQPADGGGGYSLEVEARPSAAGFLESKILIGFDGRELALPISLYARD